MSTTENGMYGNSAESSAPDANEGGQMNSSADNPYGTSASADGEAASSNPYGSSEPSSGDGDVPPNNPYDASSSGNGEQNMPSGDVSALPDSETQQSDNSGEAVNANKVEVLTNEDLKTEILQPIQRSVAKKEAAAADAYGVILVASCALLIVAMQWIAALAKGFFSTDSRKRYSIISGASFGYLLIKGVPFVLEYLPFASKKIKNLYLGNLEHLLLVVFGVLSLGFVFNYIFEKRAARNMIEEMPHGPLLYGSNLAILGIVHFFFGLHLETLFKSGGSFELIMITVVIGALVFCESITLANTFSGRSSLVRQIFLSSMIVGGLAIRKLPFFDFTPLMGILTYSFIMGYFIMSALRIEFAIVKRNCDYPTFIISFSAVVAFVVIESLYSSIGNSCPAVCALP
ncbi:MAG TPA: hypothetical protein DIC42_00970 [Holosporales bacterium]|nr:hypothetical protein [Holosporales bacterium]